MFTMNKIISNKYIYVGIISALGLGGLLTLFLIFFSSDDIEGDWSFLIALDMISDGIDKSLTAEEIKEQKEMISKYIEKEHTFTFKNKKILLNNLELSTWSLNDNKLLIMPIIDSIEMEERSPQIVPWNYSKKSDWLVNFKNDSIMTWESVVDSSLSLTFKRH